MSLRSENLEKLDGGSFDVLIVGGGINGAVSAAALTDRGLRVALIDRGDFAGFTSQESSNLVWGGFKYLENYELPLVWKLCTSRNHLMRQYPTQISEVGFLATLDRSSPFPPWLAAIGSVGYWAIGRFFTSRPSYFGTDKINEIEPVVNTAGASGAIEYMDAYLKDNDARFVWGFVRSALDGGATAVNYASLAGSNRSANGWEVTVLDELTNTKLDLEAASIVNAAGPFVDGLNEKWDLKTKHRIVYSKGIHLVVPRLTESERVLAFFDDTQRLFYVIPMAHRSVIGTTDTRTEIADEGVNDEDRQFLLDQINSRLNLTSPLTTHDIIGERSGVRPLVVETSGSDHTDTDWTKLSRKHEVETDENARVVSIFGGKLTDCLNVGEEVAEALEELAIPLTDASDDWFGEPSESVRNAFYAEAAKVGLDRAPAVERAASAAEVLWRRHGRAAYQIVRAIEHDPEMGKPALGDSDVLWAEVALMGEREMIATIDDFLRRRTKLSLIYRRDELLAHPDMPRVQQLLGL
ncbi:MAG: FAD-dependent oxidoreductase [Acidimicrobiales bacterium]|nr:FAD-dependent oxidoreductase [Acidimicrobiales bacterium]